MVQSITHAQLLEENLGEVPIRPGTEHHPEQDVLQGRISLEQVKALEDVAHVSGPEGVSAGFAQALQGSPIEQDLPPVRAENSGDHVQEGRLPRAARAFNPDLLTGLQGEVIYVENRLGLALGRAVGLDQVLDLEERHQGRSAGRQDTRSFRFGGLDPASWWSPERFSPPEPD